MAYTIDDEQTDGSIRVRYPYFETIEPLTFDDPATYVDTGDEQLIATRSHEWSHGLGEVFMALTNAGLVVTTFDEHRFLDWRLLPQQLERDELFYLPDDQVDLLPMQYSMLATQPD